MLRVDGVAISDAQQLRDRIRQSAADGNAAAMVWQIARGGGLQEITVRPRVMTEGSERFGRIDAFVGRAPEMVTVHKGPIDGLVQGAARTGEVSLLTVKMLGRMLVGEASLKNLSGPLTIADYAGQSVQLGLAYYLGFLALVSVSLGVLNLLPLPMLDGWAVLAQWIPAMDRMDASQAQSASWIGLLVLWFTPLFGYVWLAGYSLAGAVMSGWGALANLLA